MFEWFAELLTNTTRDAVAPAMRAAGDDVAGPYSEIFTSDTRDLMGFFVVLRKLLVEVCLPRSPPPSLTIRIRP